MSERVPYAYVERKVKESNEYPRAIEKWGKKTVDDVSIPYLTYVFNLFREHGMLNLRRKKSDPLERLELFFGAKPVKVLMAKKAINSRAIRGHKARVSKRRRMRKHHFRLHLRRH